MASLTPSILIYYLLGKTLLAISLISFLCSNLDYHIEQALTILISNHQLGQTDFPSHVSRLDGLRIEGSETESTFAYRKPEKDRLFRPGYNHVGEYNSECRECDPQQLVKRTEHKDTRPKNYFQFHLGTVASGNAVIQDGKKRDSTSQKCSDAYCFEVEAVGISLSSRCLVVRGIADYADSHKNDDWKGTTAGNAAAFGREFLRTMNPGKLEELSGIFSDRSESA